MKTIAILLMIVTILAIGGFGIFYLLGFAMSFDAPGSDKAPGAWAMRLLMFSPAIFFLIFLIIAIRAFQGGHYNRSVLFGSLTPVICIGLLAFLSITSMASSKSYRQQMKQEAEDAVKYPKQEFTRPAEGGTDTIIVFPSRIVAYRLYQGTEQHYGGPLGDLNETRDAIIFLERRDNRLKREDLSSFIDNQGRKLTDLYEIR